MATAAIGAGASVLSSVFGGKGAAKAAKAQAAAQQQALAEQQREFATNQANFAPYLQAGQGALGAQQTLLGLNGSDQQGSAIAALQQSPLFTSQYGAGLDAINQNAAATGGLRGGNTALAQSNFGSSLLATVLQNQLGNLGNVSQLGVGAAGTAGGLGQNNVNAQSGIFGNIGNANATAAASPYAALASGLQGIGSSGIGSLFGGGGGASSGYGAGQAVTNALNMIKF